MQLEMLWFVLAGFVLGFATSTLWEWYHFRRERLRLRDRRVQELEEQLRRTRATLSSQANENATPQTPTFTYRSPGVFLDAEARRQQEAEEAATEAPVSPRPFASEAQTAPPPRPEEETPEPLLAPSAPTPMAAQPTQEPSSPRSTERATVPPRTDGYPDDLAKIKGVGHAYKQRLYQAGIYTWRQVAETDVETLRAAARANQGANVEEWPAQARALAEKYGRQNATYTGPPPDDLTRIRGIGPVNEEALYRAGICTFEQLANASPQELRSLLPPPVAGEEPDVEDWIRQAAKLANARSRRPWAAP
ncbi:MAG: hypothetical protein KatS3mg050_1486 [Litorilinea sp.]|nr:MAG: hypothetical protein KatS3mg050_1486 [Litorilinea sp.]